MVAPGHGGGMIMSLQIVSMEREKVLSKVHQEPRSHILEVEWFCNPLLFSLFDTVPDVTHW